jgi:hypothetical protein
VQAPLAVACQIAISDEAAIAFTERFYRAMRGTKGNVTRAVEVGRATLAKDFPPYADAVFLVNGDMLTDEERGELMRWVQSEIRAMSTRLEGIEATVNDMRESQMRRMMIAIGLLFVAELAAPFLMRWLMN